MFAGDDHAGQGRFNDLKLVEIAATAGGPQPLNNNEIQENQNNIPQHMDNLFHPPIDRYFNNFGDGDSGGGPQPDRHNQETFTNARTNEELTNITGQAVGNSAFFKLDKIISDLSPKITDCIDEEKEKYSEKIELEANPNRFLTKENLKLRLELADAELNENMPLNKKRRLDEPKKYPSMDEIRKLSPDQKAELGEGLLKNLREQIGKPTEATRDGVNQATDRSADRSRGRERNRGR